MSRTNAHKNYLGQLSSHRRLRESHDHRAGGCDLPSREEWELLVKREPEPGRVYARFRCSWGLPSAYYVANPPCRDACCTGHWGKRTEKKRERSEGRRASRSHSVAESSVDDMPL